MGTTTLKFFAIDQAGNQETVRTETYTVLSNTQTWVGSYSSEIFPDTPLSLVFTQTGATVEGSYTDKAGGYGLFTATITDTGFDLSITSSDPDCPGIFSGSGTIIGAELVFTFSGSNCEGIHNDGIGSVRYQVGMVQDYGQKSPANLVVNGTDLLWTDLSEAPIKKMPIGGGDSLALTRYLGVPIGMTIQANDMYWIDYRDRGSSFCTPGYTRVLNRTSLDGLSNEILASGDSCLDAIGNVVVDNDNAYWITSRPSPNEYSLQKVPLDGSAPVAITTSYQAIETMTRDDNYLYWVEGKFPDAGVIKKIPLAGGDITEVYTVGNGITGNLILEGSNLFVAEIVYPYPDNYRLLKIPVTGGPATILATIARKPVPIRIASDADNIYWFDATGVFSMPINGGAVASLAAISGTASAIMVDSAGVVWLEIDNFTGSVYTVPLQGGPVSVLATDLFTPYGGVMLPDSDVIYLTEGDYNVTGYGRIANFPRQGGSLSPFITGITAENNPMVARGENVYTVDGWRILNIPVNGGQAETLARSDFYIRDLAFDGVYVYWLEGGPYQAINRIAAAGGAIETLAVSSNFAEAINTDDNYLYWLEDLDTIKRVPINGGDVITVASTGLVSDFISDGTYVYFSDVAANVIQRVSIDGGPVTFFASLGRDVVWASLAQDDTHIYSISEYDLRKISKATADITVLIPGGFDVDIFNPSSIDVDATSVFWTEYIGGTIKSYPK